MNTLSSLLNFIGGKIPKIGVYEFTASSVSSLPYTNNSATGLTSDHVLVGYELTNQSAQTGEWTVTTGTDSFQITGTISGTTTITLRFGTKVN